MTVVDNSDTKIPLAAFVFYCFAAKFYHANARSVDDWEYESNFVFR